jgi:hypothetical protein
VTDLAVSAGAGSVAHGVHYTVLGIGLLGLVVLLAPGRRSARVQDEHALRVEALRHQVAVGALGGRHAALPALPPAFSEVSLVGRLWLPLAVISCTAAAGVHAAVGPAHFREKVVLGLFFAVATVAQLAWSIAVVVRPSDLLLRLGALGNAALIALWVVTRTVGLPGLLPGPEEVGSWDLACVGWELVAVITCLPLLGKNHGPRPSYRVAQWVDWDHRARLWAYVSIVGLGLLSISGAGS